MRLTRTSIFRCGRGMENWVANLATHLGTLFSVTLTDQIAPPALLPKYGSQSIFSVT